MTQRATTALSLHYHVKAGKREAVLVEIKGVLTRCAQEPEFITGIVHETPERPNEFVFYELWRGTRADFDAIQGPKPYRKAYMENVKPLIEKVDVEWNSPILEWGTNLTGLNDSRGPEHASAARAQGRFYDRLLVRRHCAGQTDPAIDCGRLGQPALVDGEFVGVGDDHRPLDDVLKLTHVPGPSIGLQAVECPLADPPECLTRLAGVATDEVLHEHGNVFLPFP